MNIEYKISDSILRFKQLATNRPTRSKHKTTTITNGIKTNITQNMLLKKRTYKSI